MKYFLLIVLFFFHIDVFSQEAVVDTYYIKGQIKMQIGQNTIVPSAQTIVLVKYTGNLVETDSLGYFQLGNLLTGNYVIQIVGDGFRVKDTVISINEKSIENLDLLFVSNCDINYEIAELDIKKGFPKLLILGGIVPIIELTQKQFEEKYGVKYFDFGCNTPAVECAIEYNKRVFQFLDIRFGKGWRSEVRKDVAGL